MVKELSVREWLIKNRSGRCPQHGGHIPDSLVKYSGYCSHCNQFWKFRRWIEHRNIPYWWYYFNPDTREIIGECFHGSKKSGKSKHKRD